MKIEGAVTAMISEYPFNMRCFALHNVQVSGPNNKMQFVIIGMY